MPPLRVWTASSVPIPLEQRQQQYRRAKCDHQDLENFLTCAAGLQEGLAIVAADYPTPGEASFFYSSFGVHFLVPRFFLSPQITRSGVARYHRDENAVCVCAGVTVRRFPSMR